MLNDIPTSCRQISATKTTQRIQISRDSFLYLFVFRPHVLFRLSAGAAGSQVPCQVVEQHKAAAASYSALQETADVVLSLLFTCERRGKNSDLHINVNMI